MLMKQGDKLKGLTGCGLKALLSRLCDAAHRDIVRLAINEPVAVHQLRLRMKKLHALLRLAADGIDDQTLRAMQQHVRAVKGACAQSRDATVRGRLIDRLANRFHLPEASSPRISIEKQARPSTSSVRHHLHALEQLIQMTSIEELDARAIVARHTHCYRKGRRLLKQIVETANEPSLHRWRHRVKDLYFQTLALNHLPGARKRAKRSARLGSLLGHDHDLVSLMSEPAFRSRRGPWPEIIHERREKLRLRYLSVGHKLFAPHSAHFRSRISPA